MRPPARRARLVLEPAPCWSRRSPAARSAALTVGGLLCLTAVAVAQPQQRTGPFKRFLAQLDGLAEPAAVAVAPSGDIYITDTLRDAIRAYESSNRPRPDWKLDRSGAAALRFPGGLAVAPDGVLWVSDSGHHQVKCFDAAGSLLRVAGGFGAEPGQLNQPRGIAADARHVYVADTGNDRVVIFGHDGRHERTIARLGDGPGRLNRPHDVAVDPDGAIYVADTGNHRVVKLDAQGCFVAAWGEWGYPSGFFDRPAGLDYQAGLLFVADAGNHRVQMYDAGGRHVAEWGVHTLRPHEGRGRIHYPSDVAASPDASRVVIAEAFEDRAQVFTADPAAGEPLSPIPPEQLGTPHFGTHVAADGRFIVIPEPDAHTVKVYDAQAPGMEPIHVTNVGRYGRRVAECNQPAAAALDARRSLLYVGDAGNRRLLVFRLNLPAPGDLAFNPFMARLVRCIDLAAMPVDVPGLGWRVLEPGAIKLDRDGNLYLVDSWSACVAVLNPRFEVSRILCGDGSATGRLCRPTDVAIGPDGAVHVVDAWLRRVVTFQPDGTPRSAWDGEDEPFAAPWGIVGAPDGSLLVTDAGAGRVRVFSAQGRPIASWGEPGMGARQFCKPAGMAFDPQGRLIVMDYGNHRAQFLSAAGDFLWAFGARLYVVPAQMATRHQLPPQAASKPAMPHMVKSNGGTYYVMYRVDPAEIPTNEPFVLTVRVIPAFGGADPLSGVTLAVDGDMPQHGHGLVQSPVVTPLDDGLFEVRGVRLHMPGRWELYFDITRGANTERAQVEVTLD